jgi:hypothetical protein
MAFGVVWGGGSMKSCRYPMSAVGLVLVMALLAAACTPANPFRAQEVEEQPQAEIQIVDPANFSTAARGGTVVIRARVVETRGISSITLRVDGQAMHVEVPSGAPVTTQWVPELFWTPSAVGPHQVQVVVQDLEGNISPSDPIVINVVEVLSLATVVKAATNPTPTTVPTSTPTCPSWPPKRHPPLPKGCMDNSAFVADVGVPDGTEFDPGTPFTKIWRLRNTGTCTWDLNYELVFVGGSKLGASDAVRLPQVVAPGQTVEISVPMVAPNEPGTYRGEWQMRTPNCQDRFGGRVYVLIKVRSGGGGDRPVIHRLEVIPGVISPGQSATLYWEYTNGTSALLYPEGRSVGASGSQVVSPASTTTYRLVVSNQSGSVERAVTLAVQTGPPAPPAPPSPANLIITVTRLDGFDLRWTDTSAGEQGFRLYNANTGTVVTTFGANTVTGTVSGLACGTTYRFYLVAFNEGIESWPGNTVQGTTSPCGS